MSKPLYNVNFSITGLSLKEQQHIFETVLAQLDYNQRLNFHIEVVDYLGGKHYIWDGTGIDPNGVKCNKCNLINCDECNLYKRRQTRNLIL